MTSDWKMTPLGDLCSRVTYGFTNPMPTIEDEDGPYMVTAKDIKNGRINYLTARRTSWDAYNEKLTDKSRPREGDILLTKDGSIGRLAICDRGDICINQSVALLQGNGEAKSEYLKYVLESPEYQRKMEGDSDGTTIKHIYITRVDKMEVPCPPLNEQISIANVLGTLDKKIEVNRETNQIIESVARSLFKSWFVDFDPVKAKAEGRPTGLPNEISELFPDSLEESAAGEIPTGWSRGDLNNLGNLNPESWSAKNHPSELVYVDLSGTKNGKIEETVSYEWFDAPSRARRVLKKGDTIVGTVRPGNRSFSLVQRDGLTASTGFAVVTPNESFNKSFIYVAATSDENIARLARLADGGAYPAVRPHVVMETPINIPSRHIQTLFGEITDSLFQKVGINEEESSVLMQLRDALLPPLISGELRVPDAKKMLEEVGI